MAKEMVKHLGHTHLGHSDPMTLVQQQKDVETRFETATNLSTPLVNGLADLEENCSLALWALELSPSEVVLRAQHQAMTL